MNKKNLALFPGAPFFDHSPGVSLSLVAQPPANVWNAFSVLVFELRFAEPDSERAAQNCCELCTSDLPVV